MSLSQVAIIGRPNVGKSSLFNRLAGRRVSIVDPKPGVTRDRISHEAEWDGFRFEVMDTGGIGIVDEQDLAGHVQAQIDHAVKHADLILFLVDARAGLTPLDLEVAAKLRTLSRPFLLVANKTEGKFAETEAAEFYRLGLGEPLPISAKTGHGIDDLLDRAVALLREKADPAPAPAEKPVRIAIAGRRNAGKSTLVNALAGEERVIVSEIPGTTRDAVDVRIEKEGKPPFVLIDTAGLRKKKSIKDSVEFFSFARAQAAVRRADVILLVFDCNTELSEVDKKLARFVADQHKPCIIVGSKWDLARASSDKFQEYIRGKLPQMHFCPISFLSSLQGKNLWETIDLAFELHQQAGQRVSTSQVNKALEDARSIKMPRKGGGQAKIYYGTQTDVYPPTLLLFVNEPKYFGKGYDRFLQNQLRDTLPFAEVPLRLVYRRREKVEFSREK